MIKEIVMDDNKIDSVSILTDAVSHPGTSAPLIAGFLLTIYSLTLAPFVGGFAITFPLGLIAGVAGLVHGSYKFFAGQKDYDKNVSKQMEEKLHQAEEKEQEFVQRTVASLTTDFTKLARVGCSAKTAKEGLRELRDLLSAEEIVRQEIQSLTATMKFSTDIVQIESSVRDLLRQGLSLLCKTRDLLQSIAVENEAELTQEVCDVQEDIKVLKSRTQNEYSQKTLELKQSSLASKQGRLNNIAESRDLVGLLLSRVDECENTLRSTYNDLIKMNVDDSEEVINNVLSNLQHSVKIAMEIRKQYSKNQIEISVKENSNGQ